MLILPRYNDIFGYSSQYRHIGYLDITIPRYNDLFPLLPRHIVISGFRGGNLTLIDSFDTKFW